jgi:ribonuclease R
LQLIAFLVNKKIKQRKVSSKEINDLLHEFKDSTEANVVNQILIRSLPKAIYSHQNFGHFGLGFDDYTHFTSPIRRYADLIVHRFIKEYSLKKLTQDRIDYLKMFVKSISAAITFTERTSMETERAANKVALVMIAENYIGEEFEGTVTGVTSFGLFITVDKIFVEGLLHIKDITDDYYFFDEEKFSLIGRRKKKIYRIGSRIKVKIVKTNLNKRNIDFCLVTD